jgi:hypothetical protein
MNFKYLIYFLPSLVHSEKIIKNVNLPACRNCIHYQPDTFYNDFTSLLNKCNKFGDKNIVTDKITYDFADHCRNDDSKCGKEGKYFVEEPNINMKVLKYSLLKNMPYGIIVLTFGASIFSTIYLALHAN